MVSACWLARVIRPLFIDHQNRTGHRLDDGAKTLLAGAQLGGQLRGHAIMSQPSS
jgi:hypothetical protein